MRSELQNSLKFQRYPIFGTYPTSYPKIDVLARKCCIMVASAGIRSSVLLVDRELATPADYPVIGKENAMDTGEILRVAVTYKDGWGSDIVNTWTYQYTGNTVNDDDVADDVKDEMSNVYEELHTYVNDGTDPDTIKIDVIEWNGTKIVTDRTIFDGAFTPVTVPGAADHGLPPTTAPLITGNTNVPKRRARKYLLPIVETESSFGECSATVLTALATLALEWLNGKSVDGGQGLIKPCIMSTVDGAVHLILEAIVRSTLGTQRRRRRGVGS